MRRFILILILLGFLTRGHVQAQQTKTLAVRPQTGVLVGNTVYTNSYALLVGIKNYSHLPKTPWLEFADKDVLVLRETLIRSYGFPAENIITLLDEQATRDNIRNALTYLTSKKRVQATDRLLVCFDTRAQLLTTLDGDNGVFLILYDAQVDQAHPANYTDYYHTCLPMRELWAYVESGPVRHSLVMVDACVGGLPAHSKGGDAAKVAISKDLSQRAYQLLTAGVQDEKACEDPALGHSVFMYSLVKLLEEQAKKPDTTFTTAELYGALKTSVTDKSGGKQTPQLKSYSGSEGEVLFVSTKAQDVPPLVTGLPKGFVPEERTPRVRVVELISQAGESYSRKDYKETEGLIRQALQIEPNSDFAYNVLGNLYYHTQKDYAQAEAFFKKAIEINPQYADAYNNLGYLYNDIKHNWVQAETFYKKAIEVDPQCATARDNLVSLYTTLGFVSHGMKNDTQGEAFYKKAIEVDPQYATAYFKLGDLYYDKQDYKQAEVYYKKVIEIDPSYVDAYNNLGVLYYRIRYDYAQAEAVLKKAIELEPKYAFTCFNLGVLYVCKQDYAQAEMFLKKAIELNPKYAEAYYNLGMLYDDTKKDYVQAEAFYKKAVEFNPQFADAYNNLGNLYYEIKKDYAQAEVFFKKAVEVNPQCAEAYCNLGILYKDIKKDYAQAEEFFKKAIEVKPQYAKAYFKLGFLSANIKQDYTQAEVYYKKAIELNPQYAEAYNDLGALYANNKKDYAQAEVCYEKAIEFNPQYATAYNNLGSVYAVAMKNYARAEVSFRKAIELNPQYAGAYANLATCLNQEGKREEAIAQARKAQALGLKDHPIYKALGL